MGVLSNKCGLSEFDLKLFKALLYEIFFLIALGGGVRAMNAGLACPDWPLCFGQFIPDLHFEVYLEFLHRALAGIVAIISTYLNIKIIRGTEYSGKLKLLAGLCILLLFSQVIMGGLTVLLLLKEGIVTAHLGMGTAFFALSLWLYLETKEKLHSPKSLSKYCQPGFYFAAATTLAVFGQILLGGLVASHYAATACPDFPLCNGQWIPTLKGHVGLQVIHRLGAYVLTIIILSYVYYIFSRRQSAPQNWQVGKWFLPAIILQISVGIANVLFVAPPLITVTHLALGTLLLGIGTGCMWVQKVSESK